MVLTNRGEIQKITKDLKLTDLYNNKNNTARDKLVHTKKNQKSKLKNNAASTHRKAMELLNHSNLNPSIRNTEPDQHPL